MATLVDHMVPPFKKGGLLPELAKLSESIDDYHGSLISSRELAEAYAEEIRQQVTELGIAKDLGLDVTDPDTSFGGESHTHESADQEVIGDDLLHTIEEYIGDLRDQNIPYGLHTFGRAPEKAYRDSTVEAEAIVSTDRSLLPDAVEVFSDEMERRIVASGPRELDSLMKALDGGFVPAGNGGEPIRTPDAYPTGKNFYGINPDKVPKPAAWEMGVTLAGQMLADHLEQHGRYPEKVSFVISGGGTRPLRKWSMTRCGRNRLPCMSKTNTTSNLISFSMSTRPLPIKI